MTGVVLDTNVVISALLKPSGHEERALRLALHSRVQLYVSPPLLDEYSRVMRYAKLGIPRTKIVSALEHIRRSARIVLPVRTLTACKDDDDNRILECADAAGANFLVTGNKRHFPPRWKQTQIVNAREFLE